MSQDTLNLLEREMGFKFSSLGMMEERKAPVKKESKEEEKKAAKEVKKKKKKSVFGKANDKNDKESKA
jgi:hypothetical protein